MLRVFYCNSSGENIASFDPLSLIKMKIMYSRLLFLLRQVPHSISSVGDYNVEYTLGLGN